MSREELPPLSETRPGLYRHYKGMMYEVLGTARHSETLEPMVVYRKWDQIPISKLESDPIFCPIFCLWVRPAAMFGEALVIDGVRQPRFAWVGEADAASQPG